jgi:hypothetical protein
MHVRALELSESQRKALFEIRDHHPKPYMRFRAAALLMIRKYLPPPLPYHFQKKTQKSMYLLIG